MQNLVFPCWILKGSWIPNTLLYLDVWHSKFKVAMIKTTYLKLWLETIKGAKVLFTETNGILPKELHCHLSRFAILSFDIFVSVSFERDRINLESFFERKFQNIRRWSSLKWVKYMHCTYVRSLKLQFLSDHRIVKCRFDTCIIHNVERVVSNGYIWDTIHHAKILTYSWKENW